MSVLGQPSAADGVWSRPGGSNFSGSAGLGPVPMGGTGPATLPVVNNPNLPSTMFRGPGYPVPPSIPPTPMTPFPRPAGPLGATTSLNTPIYDSAGSSPSYNPLQANPVPNPIQASVDENRQRRLMQLEDEVAQRRAATGNLQQMGSQLLQGQMDVQEQVLQYQFMLEQCMETLDQQNDVLSEQNSEIALLRSKMRHFEYLMDAFKHSKEADQLMRSMSGDSSFFDVHRLCCRDPLALPAPSTSPYFTGAPTRVTASTFQPFNPRYRSPNSRAATANILNARRSTTPVANNRNPPNSNERPSRRFGYQNQ